MDRPFPAYRGDQPYFFVSYAHRDAALVYEEIGWLHQRGFNLWYDEGIDAGTEWTDVLASAIENAALLIYFVSPDSVASQNCRNEVNYAIEHGLDVIPVHLAETELTGGLALTLSSRQALFRYNMDLEEYREKLSSRLARYAETETRSVESKNGASQTRSRRTRLISAMVVVLLLLGVSGAWYYQQVMLPAPPSIAVLPFTNLGGDENTTSMGKGLAEEVLDELAEAELCGPPVGCVPLDVASRTDSFQYDKADSSISEISDALNVAYVLEGSVRQTAGRTRITAQLIRGKDGYHVWSANYEQSVSDVFELQAQVARHVAHMSKNYIGRDRTLRLIELTEPLRFVGIWTGSADVMQGMLEYSAIRLGQAGDWRTVIQHLKNGVETEPDNGFGHLMLGNLYQQRPDYLFSLQEAVPLSDYHLAKAEELIGDDPEAPVDWFLGQAAVTLHLNYQLAHEYMTRAIEKDPRTIWPRYYLAVIALREGRQSEAMQLMQTASRYAELDVQEAIFKSANTQMLTIIGEEEQALNSCEQGLLLVQNGIERSSLLRQCADILLALDDQERAADLVREAWNMDGTVRPSMYVSLYARLGNVEKAQSLADRIELNYRTAAGLAKGYFYLGDVDRTFAALERAVLNHDERLISEILLSDWLDPIRADPRFDQLLALLESRVTHTDEYLTAQDRKASGL